MYEDSKVLRDVTWKSWDDRESCRYCRTIKEKRKCYRGSLGDGVTDGLDKLCELAKKGEIDKVLSRLVELREKHDTVARKICKDSCDINYVNKVQEYFGNLESILKGVSLLSEVSDKTKAKVLYFGEIFSAILLALAIKQRGIDSHSYRSKDLIYCKGSYLNGEYEYETSREQVEKFMKNISLIKEIPVVTGFGGGDADGNIYLFDRGGSDYVATVLGRLVMASRVEIWTDVYGVMSADPRKVKKAILWDKLDYAVCAEFALVGAKILHPKTISPVQEKEIPVYIKNTFDPEAFGTKICSMKGSGVKGISIDDKQIIFTFIDPYMLGVAGYLYDVVKVFRDKGVSIDALATTETSFSISIRKKYYTKSLEKAFDHMREHFRLSIRDNVSKISIIGDSIDNYKILNKLKDVIMVSKWAYDKSLTVFVEQGDSEKILKKLHKEVFGK